jgi:hypothetical protein
MDWIDLAKDREQWSAILNTIKAASQDELRSMELVVSCRELESENCVLFHNYDSHILNCSSLSFI